jgi:hypothetical protein
MFYKFVISGFSPQPYRFSDGTEIMPGGQLKSQARRVSHRVTGCDDKVGPVIRFERYGRIYKRALTRRELVFGVKSPNDGKGGGFAGLVIWSSFNNPPEVRINMVRAKAVGADNWIVQFVRKVILAAGWTILQEDR